MLVIIYACVSEDEKFLNRVSGFLKSCVTRGSWPATWGREFLRIVLSLGAQFHFIYQFYLPICVIRSQDQNEH